LGPFLLAFEVERGTLDPLVERLSQAGHEPWSAPVDVDVDNFGTIRTVVCEDPDGVMVELMELPPRVTR